ncbi:unnamed protein product [Lupinus luteus]|uniref:Uncharacterized protein n=1 Tax=Lupinus luteus TaxID=3873 RepID=A0AAV1YJ76_LUPLU
MALPFNKPLVKKGHMVQDFNQFAPPLPNQYQQQAQVFHKGRVEKGHAVKKFKHFAPPPPPPPPPIWHQPQGQVFHKGHVKKGQAAQYFKYLAPPPPPPPPPLPIWHQPQAQVLKKGHATQNLKHFAPPPPIQHQPQAQVFYKGHANKGHAVKDFKYLVPPPPVLHQLEAQVFHNGHAKKGHVTIAPPPLVPHKPEAQAFHKGHVKHKHEAQDFNHINHQSGLAVLSNKSTVRLVCKAAPNYSLTIRHGKVTLETSNPSDEHQHWYKDEKYSTRMKDSEGCHAFSLVNKATGEAIKHSIGATHPIRDLLHWGSCGLFNKPSTQRSSVKLIPYNPFFLDKSVLWTESRDMDDGNRAIRMVNNIHLNLDAYHGDKNSGSVHEGTTVVLREWNKGDNQLWKILPYCKFNILNKN